MILHALEVGSRSRSIFTRQCLRPISSHLLKVCWKWSWNWLALKIPLHLLVSVSAISQWWWLWWTREYHQAWIHCAVTLQPPRDTQSRAQCFNLHFCTSLKSFPKFHLFKSIYFISCICVCLSRSVHPLKCWSQQNSKQVLDFWNGSCRWLCTPSGCGNWTMAFCNGEW